MLRFPSRDFNRSTVRSHFLVRGLADVTAGLQLRAQKVRDAWLDGALWQVAEVGFLRTQLCRAGEFCQLQNRRVLDASAHGAPVAAGQR